MKNRFFYNMDDLRDNDYESDDPIRLTHATWSHSLTNIIQMRGLSSRNYFESKGIKKRFGGEGGGTGSYTPNDVSFGMSSNWKTHIEGGWGPKRGFDYPMVFAISESKALELRNSSAQEGKGTTRGEITFKHFVDLNYISHVFVPSFKIKEVEEILYSHGYKHIKVLPLGQGKT